MFLLSMMKTMKIGVKVRSTPTPYLWERITILISIEFNFVPNVNSIPPPISLDKSFELPEHEQMQDMEYMDPIANDPEPSPPTSNVFSNQFLIWSVGNRCLENSCQKKTSPSLQNWTNKKWSKNVLRCLRITNKNVFLLSCSSCWWFIVEEPQSDLASLPNKKEEIHHIQNDLSGKKETPEKETQPKMYCLYPFCIYSLEIVLYPKQKKMSTCAWRRN